MSTAVQAGPKTKEHEPRPKLNKAVAINAKLFEEECEKRSFEIALEMAKKTRADVAAVAQ